MKTILLLALALSVAYMVEETNICNCLTVVLLCGINVYVRRKEVR